MKKALNTKQPYQFKVHQSYTVEAILAAGGTTAFAHKTGLTGKKQMEALAKIPAITLTDEEWNEILEILNNDK